MGSWGPGNFEDDRACDYLLDLVKRLRQDIEACFAGTGLDQLNLDDGNRIVMPALDIMATLAEHYRPWGSPPVDKKTVQSWKERYLVLYDAEIDEHWPKPEYKEGRRQVVAETFDRLYNLADDE